MSWHSFKLAAALTTIFMLGGCSNIEIGALDSRVNTQMSSIFVTDTAGRAGQIYNRSLRSALYVQGTSPPVFELTSSISFSSSSTLSVRGITSTFKKMVMRVNFELKKQGSDEVLLSETITADATLGTVSSLFSQDQSETHARDRMAKLLAQRVVQRLQLFFLNKQSHEYGQSK